MCSENDNDTEIFKEMKHENEEAEKKKHIQENKKKRKTYSCLEKSVGFFKTEKI